MPAELKWVYWHRVISVIDGADLKPGELLGLKEKNTSFMRVVWDEQRKSNDLKDCCKLEYLGRLLRTATAEEVHNTFKAVL